MKPALRFLSLLALFSAPHLASAYYDPGVQRWMNRDPLGGMVSTTLRWGRNHTINVAHWETSYEGPNLYSYVLNNPVALTDQNGLWTIGIGLQGSYGFIIAGGVSGGFYFGHGPGGWSFGFLGGPFLGGGGFGLGGGGFVSVTSAPCVSTLKGLGGQVGGSVGEVGSFGGYYIYGVGYGGGELTFGFGVGTPIQIQGGGTATAGPVWGAGSK